MIQKLVIALANLCARLQLTTTLVSELNNLMETKAMPSTSGTDIPQLHQIEIFGLKHKIINENLFFLVTTDTLGLEEEALFGLQGLLASYDTIPIDRPQKRYSAQPLVSPFRLPY